MISAITTFSLGKTVATQGALAALQESGQSPSVFLERHSMGNWGDVSKGDWAKNDAAIEDGDRIMSAYMTAKGVRIWMITEGCDEKGERSSTCLLLPDEY